LCSVTSRPKAQGDLDFKSSKIEPIQDFSLILQLKEDSNSKLKNMPPCGRYSSSLKAEMYISKVSREYKTVESWKDADKYKPCYNVSPGQYAPVLYEVFDNKKSIPVLHTMKWGLIPPSGPSPSISTINARCETLASSPLYHRLLQTKRCIVLHDGFYEWQQANGYTKPFFVKVGKGEIADASDVEAGNLIPMAGLYDCWRNPESGTEVYSYTIITTEAAPDFAHIHDRMPCILKSTNEMESWLHCAKYPFEAVKYLLRPHSGLHWYQVSPFVGNVRNNTPQCFRALDSRSQITTFFMARKDEGEQQRPPLKSEPQETTQPIAESSSETTGEICCAFNESKPLRTFEETKAQLTPSKRPPSNTSPQLAKRPRPISSFFKPKPDPK